MPGPFDVEMTLRDGEEAAMKMARRWKLEHQGDTVRFHSENFDEMYWQLIRCCYLMPFMEHALSPAWGPIISWDAWEGPGPERPSGSEPAPPHISGSHELPALLFHPVHMSLVFGI
jgi:hypothetical protein